MKERAGAPGESEITRFLSAWFAVRQVIQAANFNHFHQAGLSATQFMTLNLLPENEDGIAIGELAKRLNLKPPTVAKTVDSLEERKMLARSKSATDGRFVLVKITKLGRKLQNSAVGQFRSQIGGIFCSMPAADRAALIAGLESLVSAAQNQHGHAAPPLTRAPDAGPPAPRNSRRSRSR